MPYLTAGFLPRTAGARRPFRTAGLLLGFALLCSQMVAAAAHAADDHQFIHDGHTIDYALVLPDHFDKSKAYPVLLALPPGDQSRQMVEAGLNFYWEAEAKRRGWVVISPIAPSGENFYSGLERELPPLVDEVARSVRVEGGKVHLAGVSNGGLSAYRVITEFPDCESAHNWAPTAEDPNALKWHGEIPSGWGPDRRRSGPWSSVEFTI